MIAPYERLVELAELQTSLVAAEAWDDLAPLDAERAALVAGLPASPPPEARAALERLSGLQQLLVASLSAVRMDTALEIGRLGRGRGAVHGYAVSAGQSAADSLRLDGSA